VIRRERLAGDTARAAAALALGRGDALRALDLVGLSDDPRDLLLRGVAYAQLGDLDRARQMLARASGGGDAITHARAAAALVEIALAEGRASEVLSAAKAAETALAAVGDRRNLALLRLAAARAHVLLGHLDAAWNVVSDVGDALGEVSALVRGELAIRRQDATAAASALREAGRSSHAVLARAAAALHAELAQPIARLHEGGNVRAIDLHGVQAALIGDGFVVDACRRCVRAGRAAIPLARRPMLFELLLALALAWPAAVARDDLARRAFEVRQPNESHRVRLRVELARVRQLLSGIARVEATRTGYVLASPRPVAVVLPPSDDDHARISLLLADGAAWTAQALAEHAGVSKRTALRALAELVEAGRAARIGRGRETRYTGASGRIASRLLLLGLVGDA
jgi:hypothetical protein